MTIDDELLAVLRCPESGQELRVATPDELAALALEPPPDGALVREDGRVFYPVEDGFPILLLDRAIRA
jgi:uncharacterized protein YbaR (Trm112 family)